MIFFVRSSISCHCDLCYYTLHYIVYIVEYYALCCIAIVACSSYFDCFSRIGLLSRDGVRGHGEAVKEEEPMESKSRDEGVNLPGINCGNCFRINKLAIG